MRRKENNKVWVTHEYIECASAKRSSILDLGLKIGFFLTGHGSFNAFSHSFVLCGVDSKDWLHVLCVCSPYSGIRNHVICDMSVGLAGRWDPGSKKLICYAACHEASSKIIWNYRDRKGALRTNAKHIHGNLWRMNSWSNCGSFIVVSLHPNSGWAP